MATIRVHTTQNVTLEYEVGSIGDRIVANILDTLIFIAWGTALLVLFTKVLHPSDELLGWLLILLAAVPYVFYHLVCEIAFSGQSLGKKARHLRVVRLDGTSPRMGDYLLRWLLRLIDTGIGNGLVAIITIAANGKGQRLGDLAAGTTVISTRPRTLPLDQLTSPLMASGYQPVFPQAAGLSDHDVTLLQQLLHRSLAQQNYLLLNETATKIKVLLHIESGMSDEAFLRTVLRDHAHMAAAE